MVKRYGANVYPCSTPATIFVYSFWLAGSFKLSFRWNLSSAHFVYRFPCYPRLPIFNRIFNLFDLILCVFCFFLRYMLANWFYTFLSFRVVVLVGFFLLHLGAVFTSVRFSLTANVSHGTFCLVICLVGMHSAPAS